MTPTIDQIEAALPYVPAGLHCGDLTEPDERREFAEVIHGIVVQATPANLPPPSPGTHESDLCNDGVLCCRLCGAARQYNPPMSPAEADRFYAAVNWSQENARPPKPDMTIAWGITEALIEENTR